MKIDTLRVTCDKGHVSDVEIVVDAPLEVAMASMKAVRCPQCGSSHLGLGGNHGNAPGLEAPMEARMAWWVDSGERGISSQTIFMTLGRLGFGFRGWRDVDVPHDPSDFRRCKQLLDLLPEWRARLSEMDTVPRWKPFVQHWSEMESLYAKEEPTGRCPELYDLMANLQGRARNKK